MRAVGEDAGRRAGGRDEDGCVCGVSPHYWVALAELMSTSGRFCGESRRGRVLLVLVLVNTRR